MTDDVARLVLRDNYEQNVLLGNARRQSSPMLSVHKRFIKHLEARKALNRELEFLPSDAEIDRRQSANVGLTSSELAVLIAYSKITLTEDILASGMPDEPWFQRDMRRYFPREIVERHEERLDDHPLRREIITTCVSNDVVNRAGITFVFRAQEETGATPVEIVRAYTVIREVYQFEEFWALVGALDNRVPTDAQTMLYLDARRLLDRGVRWLLQTRRALLDVAAEVEHFGGDIRALSRDVPHLLVGSERQRLHQRTAALAQHGIPNDLALRAAGLLDGFSLLDIVEIASSGSLPARDVAEVYFALSEQFQVDDMLTRITGLPRGDRWSALARSALRYDLYAALAGLTSNVLTGTPQVTGSKQRIASWEEQNAEGLSRARSTLAEIAASDTSDLATMSVALRTIRTLLRS
jgi:glutamate dehydrogenase